MLLISVLRPFDIKQSIKKWFILFQPCYSLFIEADANQVWPLFNKKKNLLLGFTRAQNMFALKPLYLPSYHYTC